MMSRVLSSPVCVLGVILLPAVWAVTCSSYRDENGRYHASQTCYTLYCCGSCNKIYCCDEMSYRMTSYNQEMCSHRPKTLDKKKNIFLILGSILGSIFPLIFCVGLIVCCVAPCCLCYKKCRKRQRSQTSAMTVINVPQQPHSPSGYQPSYPGYQPVPVHPLPGGPPIPIAPPPYSEANDPLYPPGAFSQGQPMYPFPGQPYAPPPHSHELQPLPFNPSYGQNPSTE